MTPQNEIRLRRIQRIAKVMRVVCKYFLATIVLGMVAIVIALIVGHDGSVGVFSIWFKVSDLTHGGRMLVGVFALATFGVMLKFFFHLHRLMKYYSRTEIFTMQSAMQIRKMGICCALCGGFEMLWPYVPRLVLANPPRTLMGNGGGVLLIGLVIIVLSWFMSIAAEMQEENALTV
ncbi:MAG TPA: DUF2975 domain-containing protein [Acidobacteriaceae bacterium]|nr:DUF2975 domain-containing protein [Acidobacteriaceae bacterium]